MKRMEWNKIRVTCHEGTDMGNGEAKWLIAEEAAGKRTLRRRPINLNIGGLHDAVWEGY